jgi:glycoside/pentoside/hexuronide:cation symporter, GPH family
MRRKQEQALYKPIPAEARVPWYEKLLFGAGGIGHGFQAYADNQIYQPFFVLTLGISPAWMSLRNLCERLWDAVSDALVGWWTDNTKSRWGRRKPFVFAGGILGGIWLPVVFFLNPEWSTHTIVMWMIGYAIIASTLMTLWNIPYQCMLLEITPHTRERTNVAAWRAYVGKLGGLAMGWIWWLTQLPVFYDPDTGKPDIILGARWVMVAFGGISILFALLPLFAKCRTAPAAPGKAAKMNLRQNIKETFSNRSFLVILGVALLFTLGYNMKSNLDFYAQFFYVFDGDQKLASTVRGTGHTLTMFIGVLGIPVFQWLANHKGKRFALVLVMAIVFMAGLSTIACYNPDYPFLSMVPQLLVAPAWTAMWILIPSMTGDIVDEDELKTGNRREGSFSSTFSWFYKVALSLAPVISGPLIELIGFDSGMKTTQPEGVVTTLRVLIVVIPTVFIGSAMLLLTRYRLTTERINAVQEELKSRRANGTIC